MSSRSSSPTNCGLGEDVLMNLRDCSIRRIPSGTRRANSITNEVTVEFPTVELRDVVRGAAFNLAEHPEAGIRLEIPHHLMSSFKALNAASYRLRMKFKECKRNIKYDDNNFDLVLDFKTGEDSGWRRLRPAQAKEILKEDGGSAEEISTVDLSELLSTRGGNDTESDEEDIE